MEKKFIPSVANIIGTDLSKYKVIKKNQFACSLMQVSRDGKMPVAMFREDSAIMSPAYPMFEVNDEKELMPEYLEMYLSRSEFDREAVFYAIGGVRGSLEWSDFCDMQLPVPPIEEQRRIVSEYQTVERRIANNEALIQKLEETAQAIYHHTFVEGIDEENLPEGWRKDVLYDIAEFLNGKPCQNFATIESHFIPVLKIRELGLGYTDKDSDKVVNTFPKEYIIHYGDLVFSWSASLFVDFWCYKEVALNQHLFKVTSNEFPLWFCYLWIKYHISIWKNIITAKAVSMGHIKKNDLQSAVVFIPTKKEMQDLDSMIAPLFNYMMNLKRENIHLRTLLSLLTSKLS
ncbi:MAG: restriction endonuclease subunit S [Prevotella sp.]|nr:restriction endonuclease subunit S [Prevotella sp.]